MATGRLFVIGLVLALLVGAVVVVMVSFLIRDDVSVEVAVAAPAPDYDPVLNPLGDDDTDGLTNAKEVIWGTSPTDADTDKDGTLDGPEVQVGRDPTLAGPNDLLPAGFGPEPAAAVAGAVAPLAADQYFSESVDLTSEATNITELYNQLYQGTARNQASLEQFVAQQPIIEQLPAVPLDRYEQQLDEDLGSLGAYLEQAGNLIPLSDQALLTKMLDELYADNSVDTVSLWQLRVQLYQAELAKLRVPIAASELHRTLLGYSQLVSATLDQIAGWSVDPVRSMVAVRQLTVNDQTYIPVLQREITRLGG